MTNSLIHTYSDLREQLSTASEQAVVHSPFRTSAVAPICSAPSRREYDAFVPAMSQASNEAMVLELAVVPERASHVHPVVVCQHRNT